MIENLRPSWSSRLDRLSERRFALLTGLPAGVVVGLLVGLPVLSVIGLSFFRINKLKDDLILFVGPANYLRIGIDSQFLDSIPRTLTYAAVTTVVTIPIALGAAAILNRRSRLGTVVAVGLLVPWALAPIVTGIIWRFVFHTHWGLMTGLANGLGLASGPVVWFERPESAFLVAVVATAWRAVPLASILVLAGLRSVSPTLLRAARSDGASGWQVFNHVTLPGIALPLGAATVLTFVSSLQSFDILYTLAGGGRVGTVMSYYVYVETVEQLNFGYSAALAIVLLLISGGSAGALLAFMRRRSGGGGPPAISADRSEEAPAPRSTGPGFRTRAESHVSSRPLIARSHRLTRRTESLWRGVTATGAVVLVAILLSPLAWIMIMSTQPEAAILAVPPALTPHLTLSGYLGVANHPAWIPAAITSVILCVLVTAIDLVLGGLAAYPLARLRIPGRAPLLIMLGFAWLMPPIVFAVPAFLIVRSLGVDETLGALVIADAAFGLPIAIVLLWVAFRQVPASLESAARIDGCSRLGALVRISVPAAAPTIAAVATFVFVTTWNEWLFAVMIGGRELVTMSRFVAGLGPPYSQMAAAAIASSLPCLALVAVLYRRLVAAPVAWPTQ